MSCQTVLLHMLLQVSLASYMHVPDGVCPLDITDCLSGDNHALECYQAVEKTRVSHCNRLYIVILINLTTVKKN